MNEENRNKSLIRKTDAIAKYDPQKKKKLIVRGLDELENIKSSVEAFKTQEDIDNAQKKVDGGY